MAGSPARRLATRRRRSHLRGVRFRQRIRPSPPSSLSTTQPTFQRRPLRPRRRTRSRRPVQLLGHYLGQIAGLPSRPGSPSTPPTATSTSAACTASVKVFEPSAVEPKATSQTEPSLSFPASTPTSSPSTPPALSTSLGISQKAAAAPKSTVPPVHPEGELDSNTIPERRRRSLQTATSTSTKATRSPQFDSSGNRARHRSARRSPLGLGRASPSTPKATSTPQRREAPRSPSSARSRSHPVL